VLLHPQALTSGQRYHESIVLQRGPEPVLTLARLLIWMLSLLPLRILHALAVPLSALFALRGRRKAAVVRSNLRIAFPDLDEPAREALARANRVEMMRLLLETGAVWHWSEDRLRRHVRSVEGREVLDQAMADGRGALVLGGHLGNWELLTLYTMLEAPLVGLYRAPKSQAWQDLITRSRARFGGQLVAAGGPALRALLRQLRAGRAAGILIDQQPKLGEGLFVDFLGHPALTMTLHHRLIQNTGCRVLLAGCHRLEQGQGWSIEYRPAPEAAYSEDSAEALAAINSALADMIRAQPAEYLWRYKRFALQPDGQADPYRSEATAERK
jgi:KDO2-lipid IV(A) lauroyltransferase